MPHNTDRILTTHVGSLIRPPKLIEFWRSIEDGKPYEVRNRVTVCRCGASVNKPFCNGSHASIKFRDGLVEFVKLKE